MRGLTGTGILMYLFALTRRRATSPILVFCFFVCVRIFVIGIKFRRRLCGLAPVQRRRRRRSGTRALIFVA